MSIASTMAKQRWNKAHYAEIKVSLDKELVSIFKSKCRDNNVSIAGVLSGFMTGYCDKPQCVGKNINTKKANPFGTRPKRRRMAAVIAGQLDDILQNEIAYRENIPINLQEGIRAEAADDSIEKLVEALEALNEAY